jgi:hypothetical protein
MSGHYKEIAPHIDRQGGNPWGIKSGVRMVRAFVNDKSTTDQSNMRLMSLMLLGLLAATVALLLYLRS